jgi:hypothetical protein
MQFSQRTLLLLPLVLVCVLAVLFTKPANIAFVELLVISFLLPAVLTVTLVYGKGYTRSFCIGALFPAGALCFWSTLILITLGDARRLTVETDYFFFIQCLFGGGWLAGIVIGFLCMTFRWFLCPPGAPIESNHRRGWVQAIFILLLVLLVLSGPIVAQVGISAGWWKVDDSEPRRAGRGGI